MMLFLHKVLAYLLILYFNRPETYNRLRQALNPCAECVEMDKEEVRKLQLKHTK